MLTQETCNRFIGRLPAGPIAIERNGQWLVKMDDKIELTTQAELDACLFGYDLGVDVFISGRDNCIGQS